MVCKDNVQQVLAVKVSGRVVVARLSIVVSKANGLFCVFKKKKICIFLFLYSLIFVWNG